MQNLLPAAPGARNLAHGAVHPNGLTDTEEAAVTARWEKMPGTTCWMDAFNRFLNDEEEDPPGTPGGDCTGHYSCRCSSCKFVSDLDNRPSRAWDQ